MKFISSTGNQLGPGQIGLFDSTVIELYQQAMAKNTLPVEIEKVLMSYILKFRPDNRAAADRLVERGIISSRDVAESFLSSLESDFITKSYDDVVSVLQRHSLAYKYYSKEEGRFAYWPIPVTIFNYGKDDEYVSDQ